MKLSLITAIVVSIVSIGCGHSTPYNTVKTGPDRYTLTGVDPNVMQANAYTVCKNDGFPDYTVVSSGRDSMNIQCEKQKKGWSEEVSDTYNAVKNKVKEVYDESTSTTKK